jgi:hypothetical protein
MADLPATLTALATLIAAVGALFISWRSARSAQDAKTEIISTKDGVFEVGKKIDGRLTELLKLTEAAARAQGLLNGRAAEKAESKGPAGGVEKA